MAATAFAAASSRFSAAVMGRPLSVRILLASCTLVPGREEKRAVTAARPGEVKPARCERRRVASEEAQVVTGERREKFARHELRRGNNAAAAADLQPTAEPEGRLQSFTCDGGGGGKGGRYGEKDKVITINKSICFHIIYTSTLIF